MPSINNCSKPILLFSVETATAPELHETELSRQHQRLAAQWPMLKGAQTPPKGPDSNIEGQHSSRGTLNGFKLINGAVPITPG